MFADSRRRFLKRAVGLASACIAGSRAAELLAAPGFRPRLAICNETFGDWPLEKGFALAAECGYQGIELAPFTVADYVTDVSAQRRAEIRRHAEGAGVPIMGLHWLLAKTERFHLTSPERAVRRRTADYLIELTRFCADLGGNVLVFGSPKQRNLLPQVSRDDGMRYAAEVFAAIDPVLQDTGVVLALEPLSPRTTNFLATAAETVELIERVGSPRCRLHLDCLAMTTESKPIPELIRAHRDHLVHFHANDANRQGPGMGQLDFVPIFEALAEIDYRGWVSVEVFDMSPGAERIARESIAYMRKCLGL